MGERIPLPMPCGWFCVSESEDLARGAAEIGNTLIGFLALAKGFAPDEQTQELLKKLEIAVEDGTINMRFQAPLADLK